MQPKGKELRNHISDLSSSFNNGESLPLMGQKSASGCRAGPYIPARYVLCVWSFFGFVNMFTLRIDINVAILAMTPGTNSTEEQRREGLLASHRGGVPKSNSSGVDEIGPKYHWTTTEKDLLLSAFFYGYSGTQILGGILSKRFGSKLVLGMGLLVTSFLALLTPVAASYSYSLIFACRLLQGCAQGVAQPCMHTMYARWAPLGEKSKLMTITYAGSQLGTVVGTLLTGYLCTFETLSGWPALFYIYGAAGVLWSVGWLFFVHDSPETHPRISDSERRYILDNTYTDNTVMMSQVPWRRVLTSPALLAITCAHVANDWGIFALTTCLPTYLKDILRYDIRQNGVLSSLPFIALMVTNPLAGFVADAMVGKNLLSTKNTRKLMNSIGLLIPSVLMIVICVADLTAPVIVALLTSAVGTTGFTMAGYSINHLDIAPSFAGILYGVTNTVGTSTGFIGPLIKDSLTKNSNTAEQWDIFFYISAAIFFIGGLMFLLFAQGEPQGWGVPKTTTQESQNGVSNHGSVQAAEEREDAKTCDSLSSTSAVVDESMHRALIDSYHDERRKQRMGERHTQSSFSSVMQSF